MRLKNEEKVLFKRLLANSASAQNFSAIPFHLKIWSTFNTAYMKKVVLVFLIFLEILAKFHLDSFISFLRASHILS